MNNHHVFEPVPASVARPPRLDLLGPIHKAIRFAMSEALTRAGQTNFEDEAQAAAFCRALAEILAFCEHHADVEDRFVRPLLEGRVEGALAVIDDGHARLRRVTAEIEYLSQAVTDAALDVRARVGRLLYDHLGTLFTENLAHMAEEERVVLPLLWRLYTDADLMALTDRILAAHSDEERRRGVVWMLKSGNAREREAQVGALLAAAPGAVVAGIVRAAAASIPEAELGALLARCGGGTS